MYRPWVIKYLIFWSVNAVWREFLWGGIAGAFGEGMMHPIDTVKTRIQSQAFFSASQVPFDHRV